MKIWFWLVGGLIAGLLVGLWGCEPPAAIVKSVPFTSAFPYKPWQEHALGAVKASKLATAAPSDAKNFCPQGMSSENWVHLLAAMAKYESSFNPKQTFKESFKNGKGEFVVSTGLLQLSYESVAGYGFKVNTEQLKDPLLNLTIAIKILEKWIVADGVIASSSSPWRGGARYWAVLRSSGKVKAALKPFCQ